MLMTSLYHRQPIFCPLLAILPLQPPTQVKPPVGLATPLMFKSLDLARRSTADPLALMAGMAQVGLRPF